MFDHFSSDEGIVLFITGGIGLLAWALWYVALARVGRGVRRLGKRWPLAWAPVVATAVLYVVLRTWSSEDVKSDAWYIGFYLVMGTAWLAVFRALLPLFGLSARDDVLERGNNAAAWAHSGALIGGMCCFAGGNVGNGPGWWVVLFSAVLATVTLLFLWWIADRASKLAEKVTIERDPAAGLRAAGFFIATAFILGRAVAGDWVSATATLSDFMRMAWPALVLTAAVIAVERSCSSATERTALSLFNSGWVPLLLYVAAGLLAVRII